MVSSAAGAGGGLGIRVYRAARAGDVAVAVGLLEQYLADGGEYDCIFECDRWGASAFGMWSGTGCDALLGVLEPGGFRWTPCTALAWRRDALAMRMCEEEPPLLLREQWIGNPLHWALNRARLGFARWAAERVDVPATEGRVGYARAATFGRDADAIRCAVRECGADIDYGEQTALHHECKH